MTTFPSKFCYLFLCYSDYLQFFLEEMKIYSTKPPLHQSLAQGKVIKQNNRLKENKQNLSHKSSVLLEPLIINKSSSNSNSLDNNSLKSKITIISKRQWLKIDNEDSKVIQMAAKSFHAYQQKSSSKEKKNSLSKHQRNNRISINIFQCVKKGNKRLTLNPNVSNQLSLNKQSYQVLRKSSNMLIGSQKSIHDSQSPKGSINGSKNDRGEQIKDFNLQKQLKQKEVSIIRQLTGNTRVYPFDPDIEKSFYSKKQSNILIQASRNHNLTLRSNIVKINYLPLLDLNESKQNIVDFNNKELLYLKSIKQSIQEQSKVLDKIRKSQQQIHGQITIKQQLLNKLQSQLTDLKAQLKKVNTQYQLIVNFSSNQERNRILKIISKDYLQIQSELYDYAAYLQSNQLAHDLSYEPKPFSEIQKLIFQREKDLKDSLIINGNGIIENCAMMSQFISETMRILKNKDIQMLNISCFRTKCVKEFIMKMKMWLSNWELKQQYLGNLKRQFISTIMTLRNQVRILEEDICAKELSLFKINKIAVVKELIDKLELNFKFGNSFY